MEIKHPVIELFYQKGASMCELVVEHIKHRYLVVSRSY